MDKTIQESDSSLLRRYGSGDVRALEQLVEKYRRPLFGFILNMTGRHDEADDIFQEVWFRVIRKVTMYREDNFAGWIMRIAHNIIIDRARRKKPDFSLDAEPEDGRALAETMPSGDKGAMRKAAAGETGKRIEQAVAALPPEQKAVFLMRAEGGIPFKEIARIQKVSINTALARMQYALAKLREILKEDYRDLIKND